MREREILATATRGLINLTKPSSFLHTGELGRCVRMGKRILGFWTAFMAISGWSKIDYQLWRRIFVFATSDGFWRGEMWILMGIFDFFLAVIGGVDVGQAMCPFLHRAVARLEMNGCRGAGGCTGNWMHTITYFLHTWAWLWSKVYETKAEGPSKLFRKSCRRHKCIAVPSKFFIG